MDIEKRFDELEARIDELLNLIREREQTEAPRPASPGEVMGLDEAAKYLGMSPRTLRDRKAGTADIPRYNDRPVQFLRANLDAFKRLRVESSSRRSQGPARSLCLVRRNRKRTA